jgi:hypothetical protein
VAAGQHELDDSFLAQHLLLSMPEEFDYVRSITNTMKPEELTTKRVTEILTSEWQQRNITRQNNNDNQSIFMTKMNTTSRTSKPKIIKCYTCGKPGHVSKDCRLKPTETRKETRRDDRAHKGVAATCLKIKHNEQADVPLENSWVIDSAASCHISYDRDDFYEFEEASEEIEWGSESTCIVKGRGKVEINSMVGNRKSNIKLQSVLFVPSFKYKVFAMGATTKYRGLSTYAEKQSPQRCMAK